MALTITTVAGFLEAWSIVVAPDGGLFVGPDGYPGVVHVDAIGVITPIAGTGNGGYSGDGGPALAADMDASGLALGPDGSLYVADSWGHVVRRVTPDGVITTVAGSGPEDEYPEPDSHTAADPAALWAWYGRDDGPATEARLVGAGDVAVDSQGIVYIVDCMNIVDFSDGVELQCNRIRRVGDDGQIITFAGSSRRGFSGDGGPATEAQLDLPGGVAVGIDGSVYIADSGNNRIRRVDSNGVITTIAGTGAGGFSGDGRPSDKSCAALSDRCRGRPGGELVGRRSIEQPSPASRP